MTDGGPRKATAKRLTRLSLWLKAIYLPAKGKGRLGASHGFSGGVVAYYVCVCVGCKEERRKKKDDKGKV